MGLPDWRDPGEYEALARLDLASLAWEFLRRNPRYRTEIEDAAPGVEADAVAARWGLRFALSAELSAVEAPLFWRAEAAPAHVVVLGRSAVGVTGSELGRMSLARRADGEGTHLRLDGGVQVVVPAGVGVGEPLAAESPLDVMLGVRLTGLAALARLLSGRAVAPAPLSGPGRKRMGQMLRSLDGRAAGASYRDIAEGVLGARVDGGGWKTSNARDVAIRLCRSAARLMGGGYRELLLRRR